MVFVAEFGFHSFVRRPPHRFATVLLALLVWHMVVHDAFSHLTGNRLESKLGIGTDGPACVPDQLVFADQAIYSAREGVPNPPTDLANSLLATND